MQIREVELRTGLERANIRYYEKEGLLQPRRGENGYRVYSEEDVETLSRIKLLRQLDVGIEAVRRLQCGEAQLREVLQSRLQQLARDADTLEDMRQICRTLLDDGASYSDLDAQRYLQLWVLQGQRRTSPLEKDIEPRFHHPWRRLFARELDLGLAALLLAILWFGILGKRLPLNASGWIGTWLLGCLRWGVVLLLEPLCLTKWGTTPGKWLMGLRLIDGEGNRFSYTEALRRTWGVFCWGMGLELPIYSLVRLCICAYAEGNEKPLRWEGDACYTFQKAKWIRDAGYVAARVAAFSGVIWLMLCSLLPPNRRPLTVAEFTENFNSYYQYVMDSSSYVDDEGRWQEGESDNNAYVIHLSDRPLPDLKMREADGQVVAVSYADRGADLPSFVMANGEQAQLVYLALAGAQKSVSGLDIFLEIQNSKEFQDLFSDFTFSRLGVRVTNEAEVTGYAQRYGSNMRFAPEDGADCTFLQCFTVELD